LPAHFLAELAA